MRYVLGAILALFFCLPVFAQDFIGSAVKVEGPGGHGSGVYIGNGYVLTAGHVAVMGETETLSIVKPRNASWSDTWTSTVVWVDKGGDFGLLHINAVVADEVLPAAKLNCATPKDQDAVTIVGWPIDLGEIQSHGYVASEQKEIGPWKHAMVIVAPVFFGNSGGPVYDKDGKVVGLAVGLVQGTSLAIMIPISAVCAALPAAIEK